MQFMNWMHSIRAHVIEMTMKIQKQKQMNCISSFLLMKETNQPD